MEAIVAPIPSLNALPEGFEETIQGLRSEAGDEMILGQNMFIEGVLPACILRKLTDTEMAEYRRPFLDPGEGRRPTLTWPRQIPIAGEPPEVVKLVSDYGEWLAQCDVPKLFINAEPGCLIAGPVRDLVRSWPEITELTVPGIHFIQEDSPDLIGEAISGWFSQLSVSIE